MTPDFAAYEAENFEAFKKAGGDVSHINYYGPEEAQKRTRVKEAVAAYEWPAGSSHPAKLAQWLLNAAIGRGVTLFTYCSVSKVAKNKIATSWDVISPRGIVRVPYSPSWLFRESSECPRSLETFKFSILLPSPLEKEILIPHFCRSPRQM